MYTLITFQQLFLLEKVKNIQKVIISFVIKNFHQRILTIR